MFEKGKQKSDPVGPHGKHLIPKTNPKGQIMYSVPFPRSLSNPKFESGNTRGGLTEGGGALTEGGFVSINQHPLCLRPVTFPEVSGRKLPPSGRLSFHFAIHSMVPVLVGMTSCDYKFPLINKVSWSFLFPHSRLEASC